MKQLLTWARRSCVKNDAIERLAAKAYSALQRGGSEAIGEVVVDLHDKAVAGAPKDGIIQVNGK